MTLRGDSVDFEAWLAFEMRGDSGVSAAIDCPRCGESLTLQPYDAEDDRCDACGGGFVVVWAERQFHGGAWPARLTRRQT